MRHFHPKDIITVDRILQAYGNLLKEYAQTKTLSKCCTIDPALHIFRRSHYQDQLDCPRIKRRRTVRTGSN